MTIEEFCNLPKNIILEQIFRDIHVFYEKNDFHTLQIIEIGPEHTSKWGIGMTDIKCSVVKNGQWIIHGVREGW